MLGMGVLIRRLADRVDGDAKASMEEVFKGKECLIKTVAVADEVLAITFDDGGSLTATDTGQSCCEHRYMVCDDDLAPFVGSKLINMEILEAESLKNDRDCCDVHDVEFLRVTTDKGSFTVSNHNEHNGYYGGFYITINYIEPGSEIH